MANDFTGVLTLKTSQPELPPRFLQRPRLDSRLSTGSTRAVTLVCAGAGYGKTLAVTAWVRGGHPPGPVAWLTTTKSYTARGFWTDVLDCLRISGVLPETGPLWEIAPGTKFGAPELNRILEALTRLPTPVVLVLDDFHHVTDVEVLDFMSRVVEQQIPQLHLVIVTRAEPRLRLSRLRLANQITEISAEDLAFTVAEAREVCALSGHPLAAHDLVQLLDRTQGWPAGVRLALLNLSDPGTKVDTGLGSFGGNNHMVAEYLLEEVLDQLPAGDRRFLLATSVADQLTADLARHLTGRSDSQLVLETLVARNALTVRLADRPNWFRYHPLLLELLRDRFAAENPDGAIELNKLAAEWFTTENEMTVAIRHYSLAGDWVAVLRVLGGAALPLMLSPQASSLTSALSLADEEAKRRPSVPTLLAAMVCAYHEHDFDSMSQHAEGAAQLLDEAEDQEPAAVILIAIARMVHARTFAPVNIVEASSHLMDLAEGMPRQHIPSAPGYALIAFNNRAIGMVLEGRFGEACADLARARSKAERAGMGLMAMAAMSYLALAHAMVGDVHSARSLTTSITDLAERRGWLNEPQLLAAVAAEALVNIQLNDLDHAQNCIDSPLSSVPLPNTDIGSRVMIRIAAVAVATSRGDFTEAHGRLRRLLAEQNSMGALTDLLSRWSRVAHADVLLLTGQPEGVLAMIEDPGDSVDFASALERISRAKALLALADPDRAITALGPAHRFDGYRVQATEAAILESIARLRLHHDVAAIARFADALALAEPAGLIAPFVNAGTQIATQLHRQEHLDKNYGGFLSDIVLNLQPPVDPSPMQQAGVPVLTEREMAVLQYLPTVLRASDIAVDLFISVNTVKTHMRGIYNKLSVNNRREAVERARQHQLL
ncbi:MULTISPECIES: LuxR C-terminal-related transcriptional regulator [Actinomycetes]|uniref:LuxR C-terminal-related transcriptional regulator n=1 Tax=Actinomycetes TaxID=1760 RepID=UPI000B13BF26|nr:MULTISPECIES: LuxR C-terminal-related transcriptional regulator [Actinomycetes]